jgi:hypothetical protein
LTRWSDRRPAGSRLVPRSGVLSLPPWQPEPSAGGLVFRRSDCSVRTICSTSRDGIRRGRRVRAAVGRECGRPWWGAPGRGMRHWCVWVRRRGR